MTFLCKQYKRIITQSRRGFILPFTMLISTLILLVSGSTLTLLTKQLYFSKIYKQSQLAYYAADDAMTCAVDIDDSYSDADGLGIFPYSTSTDPAVYIAGVISYVNDRRDTEVPPLPHIVLDDVRCAQSYIFRVASSSFEVSPTTYTHVFPDGRKEEGRTSSFMMRMDLGVDPSDPLGLAHIYRCAKITVAKTQSFRQIVSQGYSQCDNVKSSIERAVVNTTESE